MPRTIAIGDIRGCAVALAKLIEVVAAGGREPLLSAASQPCDVWPARSWGAARPRSGRCGPPSPPFPPPRPPFAHVAFWGSVAVTTGSRRGHGGQFAVDLLLGCRRGCGGLRSDRADDPRR